MPPSSGVNHTRRGEHLLHDVSHTDCGLVVYEPRHDELIAPVLDQLDDVLVVGDTLEAALAEVTDDDPHAEAGPRPTRGRSSSPAARRPPPRR